MRFTSPKLHGAGFFLKMENLIDFSLGFGLGAALLGAASNLLAHRLLLKIEPKNYISLNFLILAIILLPLLPFYFQFEITPQSIKLFFLAGLMDALANYFFFLSFRFLPVVTASSLLAISPLFTLALQPLLDDTSSWSLLSTFGVLICVAGIVWLIQSTRIIPDTESKTRTKNLTWMYPVICAAIFGANVYLTRNLFLQEFTNPISYYFLRSLLLALIFWVLLKPTLNGVNITLLWVILLRAVFVAAQWLLMLYGFMIAVPTVVKTASEVTPLFVLGFELIFRRRKPSTQTILAAFTLVIGLILLTI